MGTAFFVPDFVPDFVPGSTSDCWYAVSPMGVSPSHFAHKVSKRIHLADVYGMRLGAGSWADVPCAVAKTRKMISMWLTKSVFSWSLLAF